MISRLVSIAARLNEAELSVLLQIAERLAEGRERYSAFDPERDGRDFIRELQEEIIDGAVYIEMGRLADAAKEGA